MKIFSLKTFFELGRYHYESLENEYEIEKSYFFNDFINFYSSCFNHKKLTVIFDEIIFEYAIEYYDFFELLLQLILSNLNVNTISQSKISPLFELFSKLPEFQTTNFNNIFFSKKRSK